MIRPGPRLVVNREEVEVASQYAVVPLARLLDPLEMFVQGLLRLERRAVYPLEHLALLVAAPVGPRHTEQLERGNPARGRDVRPGAEVLELAVTVRRDLLTLRYLSDDLQLQRLVRVHRKGLFPPVLVELERQVLSDDLSHRGLDLLEVCVAEGFRGQEVVVEAVLRGRPDGQPGLRKHPGYDVGHHVGRGVADSLSQVRQV